MLMVFHKMQLSLLSNVQAFNLFLQYMYRYIKLLLLQTNLLNLIIKLPMHIGLCTV